MEWIAKLFKTMGLVGTWVEKAVTPDEDGVVRLTLDELVELAQGICKIFDVKTEIELPDGTKILSE